MQKSDLPDNSKKVKVLYIAGSTRSGSTLIERLLGEVDGVVPFGEVVSLWNVGVVENELCGCGLKFWDCELWQKIMHDAYGDDVYDKEFVERAQELLRKLRRFRRTPLTRITPLSGVISEFSNDYMLPLYTSMQANTGAQIVVDTSKEPSYLNILLRAGFIDLYVLHVIRDSRAVAYSWQRKKRMPQSWAKQDYMPMYSNFKASKQWLLSHLGITMLRPSLGEGRYKLVRYEDFVEQPRQKLLEILSFAGIEQKEMPFFIGEHQVRLNPVHGILGNPFRYSSGQCDIKLDDEWKRAMPGKDRLVTALVTFPFLMAYYFGRKKTSSKKTI